MSIIYSDVSHILAQALVKAALDKYGAPAAAFTTCAPKSDDKLPHQRAGIRIVMQHHNHQIFLPSAWASYTSFKTARKMADKLNEFIGVTRQQEQFILESTQ